MHKNQHFASDNNAGICPSVLATMLQNDSQHLSAYGEDPLTAQLIAQTRELFETDCQVFMVYSGTAANSLSLSALVQPYQSIVAHQTAHIQVDECSAPEFFTGGAKLITVAGEHGKLTPQQIEAVVTQRDDVHFPRVKAISLTQSTEMGTVYSVEELARIHEVKQQYGLRLHMDGARFANAVATLGVAPRQITWEVGVDVLSFGGTKNGLMAGEMVVFFNPSYAEGFEYRIKQAGQLASKMRYLSGGWLGLLADETWLKNARHANDMAERLYQRLKRMDGVRILFPRQANVVFAELPTSAIEGLYALGWHFYIFIGKNGCRLMCAWDTLPETVDAFADDLQALLG